MRTFRAAAALPVLASLLGIAAVADADGRKKEEVFTARLVGYNEVPTLSSPARGWFHAKIDERAGKITYWLWYSEFDTEVTQAHLHLGQRHTAGGISAFLCTNLGNGPAGVPACPPGPATVTGTITATEVTGPAAQGIAPGELAELIAAIRAGAVYANVHTTAFPPGEIRGQLVR